MNSENFSSLGRVGFEPATFRTAAKISNHSAMHFFYKALYTEKERNTTNLLQRVFDNLAFVDAKF